MPRLFLAYLISFLSFGLSGSASAQTVPPIDLSDLSPNLFADDELDLPYYLAHFHTVANSVILTGPDRGFIDIPVWRAADQQQPYNARVMENILSLAFFYATDRPWNVYHGHAAVRMRLEAALQYWIAMQSDEGLFSEAGPEEWGLSPTAFAAKFMGESLRLLYAGPPIDPGLLEDVARADRAAIMSILTSDDFFEHGTRYSNHYTNVWGGALAYLTLQPDAQMAALLVRRLKEGLKAFQSPAGFYYERRGPDWVYEIETHHSNHLAAWHYLRDTSLEDDYAEALRRWYDWFGFNAALEPDTSGFTVNHAMETRRTFTFYEENRETTFGRTCLAAAEVVVNARAFCESVEERSARRAARRKELVRTWPSVPDLRVGEYYGYSPYAFLHRNHVYWHPTAEQKRAARAQLPYLTDSSFVHHRQDDRAGPGVTFVRRARYYAAFNSGARVDEDQRFGLGLVWTPERGTVLQSHKIGRTTWGTLPASSTTVYEAELPDPRVLVDGEAVVWADGPTTMSDGRLSVAYPLGSIGEKTVEFGDRELSVSVRHEGEFVEIVPVLLEAGAGIEIGDTNVAVGDAFSLFVSEGATVSTRATNRRVGRKSVVVIEIRARELLEYHLHF